jgi:hypothetical protein
MTTLHGYDIVIREPAQKMTLSLSVPVTDEFRASVNAWMAGFFGFYPDEILCSEISKTIYISSKNLAELKKQVKENQQ